MLAAGKSRPHAWRLAGTGSLQSTRAGCHTFPCTWEPGCSVPGICARQASQPVDSPLAASGQPCCHHPAAWDLVSAAALQGAECHRATYQVRSTCLSRRSSTPAVPPSPAARTSTRLSRGVAASHGAKGGRCDPLCAVRFTARVKRVGAVWCAGQASGANAGLRLLCPSVCEVCRW